MKAFFDVFPSLKVKSDLQDYFAKTQIERLDRETYYEQGTDKDQDRSAFGSSHSQGTNLQDAGGDLEAGIWGEDP